MKEYYPIKKLSLHGPVYAVAWSPDQMRLATISLPSICIYNTHNWNVEICSVVFSRLYTGRGMEFLSDDLLIVGSASIKAVDGPHNATATSIINSNNLSLSSDVFSQSGSHLQEYFPQDNIFMSGSRNFFVTWSVENNVIYFYDANSKVNSDIYQMPDVEGFHPNREIEMRKIENVPDRASSASISFDGGRTAVCSFSGRLYLFSRNHTAPTLIVKVFDHDDQCRAVAMSEDGALIAVGSRSIRSTKDADETDPSRPITGEVKIYNAETGRFRFSVGANFGELRDLKWSSDKKSLYVVDDSGLRMFSVDLVRENVQQTQYISGRFSFIRISSQKKIAVAGINEIVIYSDE